MRPSNHWHRRENHGATLVLGVCDAGSRLVVGRNGRAYTVVPMTLTLDMTSDKWPGVTLFPDDRANRSPSPYGLRPDDDTVTGCARAGVKVWQVMVAVIIRKLAIRACPSTHRDGFKLCKP
jgi:hypothetical protein